MDFALDALDTKSRANAGVEVALKLLDNKTPLLNAKKQPVTLTLLGSDSDVYRRINREITRARIERMQKKRDEANSDEMLDLAEREDTSVLARMTTGWSGVLDTKGKPIEFSLEAVTELYEKFPPAKEQAEAAVLDRTRFIKPSSGK